jgi:hypothetical protein
MAWELVSGGSLNSPTAGVFDFASLTLTGYEAIQIRMSGVTVTTDGTDVFIRFYVGGSEISTGYRWLQGALSTSAAVNTDSSASATGILLNSNDAAWDTGNAATESFGCTITVPNPVSTALHKRAFGEAWMIAPSGNALTQHVAGIMENTGAINGLIVRGSSNLVAGKVRVLGLAP